MSREIDRKLDEYYIISLMDKKLLYKIIIITIVSSLFAFFTGRIIWPPSPENPIPTSSQLPFLIGMSVVESVSFGLGVSFLLFGYKYINRIQGLSKNIKFSIYMVLIWMIITWWPHDNLHIHNGMNLTGLIYIEYAFHATLIACAVFLAYIFIKHNFKASK